jgi:hypothetical protein
MRISRRLASITCAIAVLLAGARPASAAAFEVGARIPLTATEFALPVEIKDGAGITSWSLDLAYDPDDVQVHVGCDPFADAYCSFITGPVTEGDFFADGAPFNLLVPGFIELDAMTREQIGRLSGVHGAYGGPAPGAFGDGTVAYVLFTTIGTGDSPITIETGTLTEVPEPASFLLVMVGLATLGRRRLRKAAGLGALATPGWRR